jgi:hypothetical protein
MTKSNIFNKSRPLAVSDYTPKNKNVPFNVTPQRHLYLGNTKYTAALKEV